MHVRRVRIARIICHALVMHQARRIFPAVILAQFVEVFAAPAFVAARPKQNARVILVTLQHRPAARQHCLLPLRAVVRHHPVVHRLPRAVRLDVRFVDDVQTVFVAQAVKFRCIRIVAGAHGVDIHRLHVANVAHQQVMRHHAPAVAVKFVAVDAVEHDTLAVQAHDFVLHLELAEAHFRPADFGHLPLRIRQHDGQRVEIRLFRAPQLHAGNLRADVAFQRRQRFLRRPERLARLVRQRQFRLAQRRAHHPQARFQRRAGVVVRQRCADAQVVEMRFGVEVQGHAAVDAAEPPEVLILHPAARAALEHAQRQPILPDVDVGGQVEAVRCEAVLRIADFMPVDVNQHRRFHARQMQHGTLLHLRQRKRKMSDACHRRVVDFAHLRRLQGFVSIPRVLRIDVVRRIPLRRFHLKFARHLNFPQRFIQRGARQQRVRRFRWIHGKMRLPRAIQRFHQRGRIRVCLRHRRIKGMIGAIRQLMDAENFWVAQPRGFKSFSCNLLHRTHPFIRNLLP